MPSLKALIALWLYKSVEMHGVQEAKYRDQLSKNFQRARPKESDYGRDSNTNRMRMLLAAPEPHSPFNYRMLPGGASTRRRDPIDVPRFSTSCHQLDANFLTQQVCLHSITSVEPATLMCTIHCACASGGCSRSCRSHPQGALSRDASKATPRMRTIS
ncbi:hypothetical protein Aduo_005604 [Ancylostoma duodenale]